MMRMRPLTSLPKRPGIFVTLALAAALAGLAVARPAFAQDQEPAAAEPQSPQTPPAEIPTFADVVAVRVVNVDVFVTNRSGDHVPGLSREDFELLVDGDPMPISNFYHEFRGETREVTAAVERPRGGDDRSDFTPLEMVQETADRRNHVVILIDHTRLGTANRKRAFKALRQAVAQLNPEDLIAVVGVQHSLVFYSDFLYDRQAIGEILDEASRVSMRTNIQEAERRQILGELTRGQSGGILGRTSLADPGQLLTRIQAYAADEYARSLSSFRQIESVLSTVAGVPGRKILLYLGEGIPNHPGEGLYVEWRNRFGGPELGMRHYDFNSDYVREIGRYDLTGPMDQLADAANRADAILYAIDAEGNHGAELRSAPTEQGSTSESVSVVNENFRAPLEYTTQATGGRLLRSSGRLPEEIGDIFNDFDNLYSLGFEMPTTWEAGSEHEIQVRVRGDRRLRVRHRNEMRVPAPDEREAGATVAALMYQTLSNPLDIHAEPEERRVREDGTAVLPMLLAIPVDKLELVPRGGSHFASLSIYVSVKDRDGNPRPVQKVPFHLDIPDDKLEEAQRDAAHYTLPLVLRPGDRQVAITVRDDVSRSLSTIRLDVDRYSQPL